ncbi:MAG: hypothetical protein U5K31_14000 [Balneolaceae bacterium]|nr:hypothetical protein [Balneolaceae bacterium]
MVWLHKRYLQSHEVKMMKMEGGGFVKKISVFLFVTVLTGGVLVYVYFSLL